MARTGILVLLSAAVSWCPAQCRAQGFFLSLGAGSGDAQVGQPYAADEGRYDHNITMEWGVGYALESNVVVEASGTFGLDFDLLTLSEYFEIDDTRVMAGYSFQPSDRFRILPKVGIGYWDLSARSPILSFDPEPPRYSSGKDWVWGVSGEIDLSRRFRVYVSYTDADYDFGRLSIVSVGAKVQF